MDATRLYIADTGNNRVLIHNAVPTSNGRTANVVLGQTLFTTNAAAAISASALSSPFGVSSNGTKLAVADANNHRILIWNTIPTSNNAPADVAVGQPNLTSNTQNNGGVLATSLSSPEAVFIDATRLYVLDTGNNRVLIWNTIPTVSGVAANYVFGQPDFVSNTANNGGISSGSLQYPYGISVYGKTVYVSDTSNNRAIAFEVP